jgi:hypothetical protein
LPKELRRQWLENLAATLAFRREMLAAIAASEDTP